MSTDILMRILFRGLRNALTAAQLIGDTGETEIRAIYVGREESEGMFELIVELKASPSTIDSFLKAVSSFSGFVEARVETLNARVLWEGLR